MRICTDEFSELSEQRLSLLREHFYLPVIDLDSCGKALQISHAHT